MSEFPAMVSFVSKDVSAKFANMSFVCACLVVFIHVGIECANGTLGWWLQQMSTHVGVTRIAVPFFFYAAGYFLAGSMCAGSGWYKKASTKRCVTLLVPYFLWNGIYLGYITLMAYASTRFGYQFHIPIPTCYDMMSLVRALGLNPLASSAHSQLWFIRCLFLLVLLSPVAKFAVKYINSPLAILALYLLIGLPMSYLVEGSYMYWLFNWSLSPEGLFYFYVGIVLRLLPNAYRRFTRFGTLSLFAGVLLFLIRVCELVEFNNSLASFWLTWIATPLTMFGVWTLMPTKPLWGNVRSYPFPIYILHQFVLVAMAGMFGMIGLREVVNHSIVLYFVRGGLAIVLCVLVVAVARRLIPKFTSVAFGGR